MNTSEEPKPAPQEPASHAATVSDFYQVSFLEENVGKHFKRSKKRIEWVFLESTNNQQQQQQHTVVLSWSKRTGKQVVMYDGNEEWTGRRKGATLAGHQWTTPPPDELQLHVLATKTTPNKMNTSNFRKYDLMINGIKFANLAASSGGDGSAGNVMMSNDGDDETIISIVDILYPDGYNSNNGLLADEEEECSPPRSTVDDYKDNQKLRAEVTARRPVRHDGTVR